MAVCNNGLSRDNNNNNNNNDNNNNSNNDKNNNNNNNNNNNDNNNNNNIKNNNNSNNDKNNNNNNNNDNNNNDDDDNNNLVQNGRESYFSKNCTILQYLFTKQHFSFQITRTLSVNTSKETKMHEMSSTDTPHCFPDQVSPQSHVQVSF